MSVIRTLAQIIISCCWSVCNVQAWTASLISDMKLSRCCHWSNSLTLMSVMKLSLYLLLVHVPLINKMIKSVFVFTQIIFDIKVCLIWKSVIAHTHTHSGLNVMILTVCRFSVIQVQHVNSVITNISSVNVCEQIYFYLHSSVYDPLRKWPCCSGGLLCPKYPWSSVGLGGPVEGLFNLLNIWQ